jgi:hypothetical protein
MRPDGVTLTLSERQIAFHTSEYGLLKSEIQALAVFEERLLIYSVGGIFAYYGWLFAKPDALATHGELWKLALAIPIALSVIALLISLSTSLAILRLSAYARELEDALGHPKLGWEKFSRPLGRANLAFPMFSVNLIWVVLIALTTLFLVAGEAILPNR